MNTFIQNNKNILIAIVAIIIVVLLAVFLTGKKAPVAPMVEDTTETVETSDDMTSGALSKTPKGEAAYMSAIDEHEGRLITVMDGCTAEPKTQTIALGEHALLVNASNTPHTFMVGDETYTVGERHYKTLRLETVGVYKVSCDDTKDIATITVE